MHRSRQVLMCLLVTLLTLTPRVVLGDARKPNVLLGDELAKVRVSPAAENVRLLSVAFSLIDYGRKNRVPEALLAAASMIASIPITPWTPSSVQKTNSTAAARCETATPSARCEPESLILEAQAMNPGGGYRVGHKASIRRNSVGGPKYIVGTASANSSQTYEVSFRGAEWARVGIKGDGSSDLDLYIYDEDHNLISSDLGPSDACMAEWVPAREGRFYIKVVNTGDVKNAFELVTN